MTRTRSYSLPTIVGYHQDHLNGTPTGPLRPTTRQSFSSVMIDTVTPNFRSKMKEGVIVNNPCSMTVIERTTSPVPGHMVQVQNIPINPSIYSASGNGTITGYLLDAYGSPTYSENPLPVLTDIINMAKQQCLAHVDDTPFSFAEDLAEIRETIRFLRDPLQTWRKLSINYKKFADRLLKPRRKLRAAGRYSVSLVDDLSSLWLEHRFAVMPVVRSCLQLMEAYETKVYRPERRTSRSHQSIPLRADARTVIRVNGVTARYWCTSSCSADVRAGILYEVSNPLNNFQYKYGLRFKDIPATLWAVMPYSFMMDRALNLTNFFQGASNLLDPNVKFLGAWVTTKRERRQSIGVRSLSESGYTSTVVPDDIHDREFYYVRSVWEPIASDILPTLELRGLVDSAAKTTDLLALIYQNYRSFTK